MSFDGENWRDGEWVYPPSYHPGAPAVPHIMGSSLATAYYHARYGARLVMSQSYGANLVSAGRRAGVGAWQISQNIYVRIAECYSHVPAEFTHLVAIVGFVCQPLEATKAKHRIVAYDGSTTATGDEAKIDVDRTYVWAPDWDLAADEKHRNAILVATCEVPLATLTLGGAINIYVEGFVATATTHPYRPMHVCVFAEVR